METLEAVNEGTRIAYNLAADRYHELFHDEMSRKTWDLALLDAFAGRFDERSCVLDAGCGPCVSAGRVLAGKGVSVIGVDISDRCVELARAHNPAIRIERGDLAALPFPDASFEGVLSYYSIIDTPKRLASTLVDEFRRVLVPGGHLLVVVKAGEHEGWESSLLGVEAEIYFSTFTEDELRRLLEAGGFHVESIETREPYPFEIEVRRIYALARR